VTAVPLRRRPGQRAVHWAISDARLIGDPRTFFCSFTSWRAPIEPARLTDGMRWRRDRVMGGGATIIDSGTHFLDTLSCLLGDVQQVYAEARAYRDAGPVVAREALAGHRENTLMAVLTLRSGVTGTWCWSTVAAGAETHDCVINGSDGSIQDPHYASSFPVQVFMRGAEVRRRDGVALSVEELSARHHAAIGTDGMQRLFPNGVTDEFALTIWDFLDSVATGRPPEIDGRPGLRTLAVAEALYESSWSGQSIDVDRLLSGETPSPWQHDIDACWGEYRTPPRHSGAGA
jgi:predicted dehydrogenase